MSIPEMSTSDPESMKSFETSVGSRVTPGMLNQKPIQLTLNERSAASNGSSVGAESRSSRPRSAGLAAEGDDLGVVAAHPVEELADDPVEVAGILDHEAMGGAADDDQLGRRDA